MATSSTGSFHESGEEVPQDDQDLSATETTSLSQNRSSLQSHPQRQRSNQWSVWSEWHWSVTYQRYYRQRQDRNGNLETMWPSEMYEVPSEAENDVPAVLNKAELDTRAAETSRQSSAGMVHSNPPRRKEIKISPYRAGDVGDYETLDPRYRLEPSHKFQPGEIFKILWGQPTGRSSGGASSSGTQSISDSVLISIASGNFYVGFRRFIVIANNEGSCCAVPILTYGGKGCSKKGVKPERHGIVYEQGRQQPKRTHGEPKLGYAPVCVVLNVEGEVLAKSSRINYSKLVEIEHSVRVLFIGHVHADYYDVVSEAGNLLWEKKLSQERKKLRE